MQSIIDFYNEQLNKGQVLDQSQFRQLCSDYELDPTLPILWYQKVCKMAFLQNLPENIEEIFFISFSEIYYIQEGVRTFLSLDISKQDYHILIQTMIHQNGINCNYLNPFLSFHTNIHDQNYRVTLTHHSLCPHGNYKLFLRRHRKKVLNLDSFTNQINSHLLKNLVEQKKNMIICGATGSGKTSLMSSLLDLCSKDEHVIILEDTMEIPHLSSRFSHLLAGHNTSKTLEDFVSYALRMSPDRLILGEVRSKEIVPLMLALNTGHRGLMCSLHASSAQDSLHRLALLFTLYGPGQGNYELALKFISKNIDYVVYMQNKTVTSICQILGSNQGQVFYEDLIKATG